MPTQRSPSAARPAAPKDSDTDLVGRVARGDQVAFEVLMRRHNTRLFRVARAILRDDTEAEDALQDAYLEAYRHMAEFRGDAQPATWLTRIVVNQALMLLRRRGRNGVVVAFGNKHTAEPAVMEDAVADERTESPSSATLRAEIRRMLERRIDELPVAFRTVFVMRDVEDMTVAETAECLSIPPATVRTRLFRARALLRAALAQDMDTAAADVFAFAGDRCDRIVAGVLGRIPSQGDGTPGDAP